MLIYEKDNKLNINFENSVEETPDLQISKESGKTEVKIDGQSGGGSGGSFVIRVKETAVENGGTKYELDKTWQEISDAIEAGMYCCIIAHKQADDYSELFPSQRAVGAVATNGDSFTLLDTSFNEMAYTINTKDGYPCVYETDAIKPLDPGDMPSNPGAFT